MRGSTRSQNAQGGAPSSRGRASTPRGIEWAHNRIGAAAGVVALTGMLMASPVLSGSASAVDTATRPGPAMSVPVKVVISAAQRPDPYDPSTVGDALAANLGALKRSSLTRRIHQKVAAAGNVERVAPSTAQLPVLALERQPAIADRAEEHCSGRQPSKALRTWAASQARSSSEMISGGARRMTKS